MTIRGWRCWLIRAIEHDFKLPAAFTTRAQRQQQADERKETRRQLEEINKQVEQDAHERTRQHTAQAAGALADLQKQHATTDRENKLWTQALGQIKTQLVDATYKMWFAPTHLLSTDQGRAVIAVPNQPVRDWLSKPEYTDLITRTLQEAIGEVEELGFEIIS